MKSSLKTILVPVTFALASGGLAFAARAVTAEKPTGALRVENAGPTSTAKAGNAKSGDGKAAPGDIHIRNSADGTALYDDRRKVSRISKDVVVTQEGEDFILNCDDITYNEGTNEAVASGHLHLKSRDSTMTGDLIRADFDAKVITLIGHVVFDSHGKNDGLRSPESRDAKSKPSELTCDRVDYNYSNRQALVTGHIHMTQEKNSGTCERILFDEERNVAHLQGNVVFENSENKRTVRSNDVMVWIDDNIMQANSRTTVTSPHEQPLRPVAPKTDIGAPPALPEELLKEFGHPLPPAPTPSPAKPDDSGDAGNTGSGANSGPAKPAPAETDKK